MMALVALISLPTDKTDVGHNTSDHQQNDTKEHPTELSPLPAFLFGLATLAFRLARDRVR